MEHTLSISCTILLTCFMTINCQTVLTSNAIAAALKDILSPSNNERAAQILQLAGSRQQTPATTLPVSAGMPEMQKLVMPTGGVAREFRMPVGATLQTQIVRPEVQQKQLVYQNVPVDYGAQKEQVVYPSRSTIPFGSPYLPAASPVSAYAPPTSNLLPPMTHSRSQHLRKIPIPPPTL